MILRNCEICGTVIKVLPCQEKTKRFCSRVCLSKWQSVRYSGSGNPAYKGGIAIYTNGKKRINSYSQKFIIGGGKKKPEHRAIVENLIGRPLLRIEHVHHINGDSLDNRNSNLLVCDVSYHRWLHEEMARRYMQEHFN